MHSSKTEVFISRLFLLLFFLTEFRIELTKRGRCIDDEAKVTSCEDNKHRNLWKWQGRQLQNVFTGNCLTFTLPGNITVDKCDLKSKKVSIIYPYLFNWSSWIGTQVCKSISAWAWFQWKLYWIKIVSFFWKWLRKTNVICKIIRIGWWKWKVYAFVISARK